MKRLLLLSGLMWMIFSCGKMDESYQKYIQNGEKIYTGKVDSVQALSGKNRIMIRGLLAADPKIVEARIYWNNNKDSVLIPIEQARESDTLKVLIDNLSEGTKSFVIRTFDKDGNRSVPVNVVGNVYGEEYISSLNNRPLVSAQLSATDLNTVAVFGRMDPSSGVFASEIIYTTQEDASDTMRLSIDSSQVILHNYGVGSEFKYRSLFLPDSISIDTFYSDYTSVLPKVTYLKNMGDPFEHAEWDGGRWGVLADWISNADIKNAGSDMYGGYELRGGKGVLSFEAGWGLRAVPNGKVYQVVNLPAGKYEFFPHVLERGDLGTIYACVAEGEDIPDFSEVTSGSIAYVLQDKVGQPLIFELEENTQVAIGLVGDMPDSGSYFKVGEISFEEIE